ncbi:hypothetical protein B0H13DRAFT_2563321 [Mycena leptocephala]|nr:hypothetical protein B0H13DRAFT_2563321 [Mycena leptocephala]
MFLSASNQKEYLWRIERDKFLIARFVTRFTIENVGMQFARGYLRTIPGSAARSASAVHRNDGSNAMARQRHAPAIPVTKLYRIKIRDDRRVRGIGWGAMVVGRKEKMPQPVRRPQMASAAFELRAALSQIKDGSEPPFIQCAAVLILPSVPRLVYPRVEGKGKLCANQAGRVVNLINLHWFLRYSKGSKTLAVPEKLRRSQGSRSGDPAIRSSSHILPRAVARPPRLHHHEIPIPLQQGNAEALDSYFRVKWSGRGRTFAGNVHFLDPWATFPTS